VRVYNEGKYQCSVENRIQRPRREGRNRERDEPDRQESFEGPMVASVQRFRLWDRRGIIDIALNDLWPER